MFKKLTCLAYYKEIDLARKIGKDGEAEKVGGSIPAWGGNKFLANLHSYPRVYTHKCIILGCRLRGSPSQITFSTCPIIL